MPFPPALRVPSPVSCEVQYFAVGAAAFVEVREAPSFSVAPLRQLLLLLPLVAVSIVPVVAVTAVAPCIVISAAAQFLVPIMPVPVVAAAGEIDPVHPTVDEFCSRRLFLSYPNVQRFPLDLFPSPPPLFLVLVDVAPVVAAYLFRNATVIATDSAPLSSNIPLDPIVSSILFFVVRALSLALGAADVLVTRAAVLLVAVLAFGAAGKSLNGRDDNSGVVDLNFARLVDGSAVDLNNPAVNVHWI